MNEDLIAATLDAVEVLRAAGLRAVDAAQHGVPAETHVALHGAAYRLLQSLPEPVRRAYFLA